MALCDWQEDWSHPVPHIMIKPKQISSELIWIHLCWLQCKICLHVTFSIFKGMSTFAKTEIEILIFLCQCQTVFSEWKPKSSTLICCNATELKCTMSTLKPFALLKEQISNSHMNKTVFAFGQIWMDSIEQISESILVPFIFASKILICHAFNFEFLQFIAYFWKHFACQSPGKAIRKFTKWCRSKKMHCQCTEKCNGFSKLGSYQSSKMCHKWKLPFSNGNKQFKCELVQGKRTGNHASAKNALNLTEGLTDCDVNQ